MKKEEEAEAFHLIATTGARHFVNNKLLLAASGRASVSTFLFQTDVRRESGESGGCLASLSSFSFTYCDVLVMN